MTRDQLEAARIRLVEAAEDSESGLAGGSLFDPSTGSYCAIGALLNGPSGVPTDVLIRWDRLITERMGIHAPEPADFGYALPEEAARRLFDLYGLDREHVEQVVNANDGAESQNRLAEVLAELDAIWAEPEAEV